MAALVPENSPPGTLVALPPLLKSEGVSFRTDSRAFSVDARTGEVRTLVALDYEGGGPKAHHLRVFADDEGRSVMRLQVLTDSVDEFPPKFTLRNYTFNVLRVSEKLAKVSSKNLSLE